MFLWMNKLLDKLSESLAHRKGLLPLIGIFLVILNFIFQFIPIGWLAHSNLLLHLGLITAVLGLLLAKVL